MNYLMNYLAKIAGIACLSLVAEGASAYTYITRGCGTVTGYSNISRTFNLASNLSTAEKVDIATAMRRVTEFSEATIVLNDNGDSSWSFNNSQNEIYHDTTHATAQCALRYNTSACTVIATDIRFGNQTWVTGEDSQHAPYNSSGATGGGRSILGTAVHEGGHCVGIGHEDDVYNMMGDERTHVTRNGVTTYYGPGEDLSNATIVRWGKRSTTDAYRDVGITVMRRTGTDGTYSSHDFGQMRDASGSVLPTSGSFEGQPAYVVVAGETVQMELTVENNGEKNTESFNTGFYLSGNSIISTGDTFLGEDTGYVMTRNIPYEVTEPVTIPIDTPPGNYFLGAYVDHDNQFGEVTTRNNVAYYPVVVLAPPSDLTVPFAGVDDTSVAPNETIKSIAVVRNDGIGPSDATTLRYYRSPNSTISAADTLIALDSIPSLAAGGQSAQNADTSAPGYEGTWYYGACVDSVARETSTSNNCSTGTQVTVSWPTPSVSTNPASNINSTSATLNATFDPYGAPHTVYFDWGETTAYGNSVQYTGPIYAGNISVTLSGLVCNTEYHFRARVVSDGGTAVGGDQQFTTLTCSGCGG